MRSPDSFSVLGGISDTDRQDLNASSPATDAALRQITRKSRRGIPAHKSQSAAQFTSFSTSELTRPFAHLSQTSNVTSPLSTEAREKFELALSHGWAASTLKGYNSNVKQFIRWCEDEHIPRRMQFPANEFVLCAFAASDVGRLSGGTARKKVSAIKAWHALDPIIALTRHFQLNTAQRLLHYSPIASSSLAADCVS